jgi:hypothetical protein
MANTTSGVPRFQSLCLDPERGNKTRVKTKILALILHILAVKVALL